MHAITRRPALSWLALLLAAASAHADLPREQKRVLVLCHSAGYRHAVVARATPDAPSLAESALERALGERYDVVCSQDAALLTPEHLAQFDAVVFYTTGELPGEARAAGALIDFVRAGGGFVGIHPATDTWYAELDYQELIGGVFDGHPWHEQVGVLVEDAGHPATAHLGASFDLADEIYQFRAFSRDRTHVLLRLDPASVDVGRGKRADGDYALAWCHDWGAGRVFYTALGHRPEVWADARFLAHVGGAVAWACGDAEHQPAAPAGALVLLADDAAALTAADGGDCPWRLVAGALEVVPGRGDVVTRAAFGDLRLHLEFALPEGGEGGVWLQERFELRLADSFGAAPAASSCAALAGRAPATNASRRAHAWQSLDVVLRAARFDDAGGEREPARVSVRHNGILVHAERELEGARAARAPLRLAARGAPLRFRNAWLVRR